MPQLSQGHLKFTEEDFLYSDYNNKILDYTNKETSVETIVDAININNEYLLNSHLLNSQLGTNIPNLLAVNFEHFLILARKYDLSLEDLIRISNARE
jgi:hypothetical protein